jgi:hypothetical protein
MGSWKMTSHLSSRCQKQWLKRELRDSFVEREHRLASQHGLFDVNTWGFERDKTIDNQWEKCFCTNSFLTFVLLPNSDKRISCLNLRRQSILRLYHAFDSCSLELTITSLTGLWCHEWHIESRTKVRNHWGREEFPSLEVVVVSLVRVLSSSCYCRCNLQLLTPCIYC